MLLVWKSYPCSIAHPQSDLKVDIATYFSIPVRKQCPNTSVQNEIVIDSRWFIVESLI